MCWSKTKQPFLIGVTNPQETNDSILSLNINDLSVVTSGTYQRYIETDSKKYHHILDPSTGYSYENGLSAVTIISKSFIPFSFPNEKQTVLKASP